MSVQSLSRPYPCPNFEKEKPTACKRAMIGLAERLKQITSFLVHWMSLPFVLLASFLKAKKEQLLSGFFSSQPSEGVKKVRFNEKVDVCVFERVRYDSQEYPGGYWSERSVSFDDAEL